MAVATAPGCSRADGVEGALAGTSGYRATQVTTRIATSGESKAGPKIQGRPCARSGSRRGEGRGDRGSESRLGEWEPMRNAACRGGTGNTGREVLRVAGGTGRWGAACRGRCAVLGW